MSSFAEELAQLANPAPEFDDPEDVNDGSGAQLTPWVDDGEDKDESQDIQAGSLRRKATLLLADTDIKYKGKKVSRKKIQQELLSDESEDSEGEASNSTVEEASSNGIEDDVATHVDGGSESEEDAEDEEIGEESDDDDEDNNDDDDDEEEKSSEDEEEESYLKAFKEKMKLKEKKNPSKSQPGSKTSMADEDVSSASSDDIQDDQEEEAVEDEESGSEDEDEEGGVLIGPDTLGDDHEDVDEEGGAGIEKFSKSNMKEEMVRGKATKCQLGLWDSLLENRIKLQKLLVSVNQLPQQGSWEHFMNLGGEDYQQAATDAYSSVKTLLDQLVLLQTTLLLQNSETKHVVDGSQPARKPAADDGDDEEITSEEDDDEEKVAPKASNEEEDWRDNTALKRKIKVAEYPDFMTKRHKKFEEYRNETIQKWFDKTRVATGKISKSFSGFEQSALKQIEQILSEKDRLIKRTQLKRSAYRVLGEPEKKENMEVEEADNTESRLPSREHLKDYDTDIFDDDDFYHQLLRELIERKASDMTDPIAISRQWLEIQKLRTKSKKKRVDTKASKGRKIRYHIHPKLVNFMAPVYSGSWTDEAKNELYSSLFGQRHSELPISTAGR